MDSLKSTNIRTSTVKMEEMLTDSGIASCNETYVCSDSFSDDSQTSTLEEEIIRLKAVIRNKDEQISILKEGINSYEHQIDDRNKLIKQLQMEMNKYTEAYGTIMKLNTVLKNNNETLEKALLNKSSLLNSLKDDYDKVCKLKEKAENTLRNYTSNSKSESPQRRADANAQSQMKAMNQGVDPTTMQNIAEGVNAILKHRANTQISHQQNTEKYNSGTFFTFYGTPETIAVAEWFKRIESQFGQDWPDHKKVQFALKRLDENNKALENLRHHNCSSYTNLKNHMLLVFGRVHKAYSIASWNEATRFQGTSFLNWTLSAIGTVLIDKTSCQWDSQNITDGERSVIMSQLRTMVPPKALQKYSSANNDWNYKKLAKVKFLTVIGDILEDEYFWPIIWNKYNKTLPKHNRYNHNSWKTNSLEVNEQVPNHYKEVISISEHKRIMKNQAINFYNARSRTQKYINYLKAEFQEYNDENVRNFHFLNNELYQKLQQQEEIVSNISWEAQQSQYDLCILEEELNNTHNEIANLQEKLLESENNLHIHQVEIRNYKEQLSKSTYVNGNVETFKMKKQEKDNEKLIRKLQKNLQEAKQEKSSVEFTNECLISQVNQLNEELRQSRIGYRKDKSVKEKVIRKNEVENDYNENDEMNIYCVDNPNNGTNNDYDPLKMYGFREDGQYGLLYD